MLVLIWLQTVCKGYQETTKVAASKERVSNTESIKKCRAKHLGQFIVTSFSGMKHILASFFLGQTVLTKNRCYSVDKAVETLIRCHILYRMWHLIRVSTAWST